MYIMNMSLNNLSNSNRDNSTPNCVDLEESVGVRVGVIILYCVIFITSIFGNSLIVATVYRTPRMRTAANLFIANMAASDVMQPIFGVPRVIVEVLYGRETWLVGGTTGEVFCKLAYFVQDVSLSVSILSLVGITIERFYAVIRPLKDSFLKSHVRVMLPLIWITAASMHCVYFYVFRIKEDRSSGKLICYQHWSPRTALIYFSVCFTGVFLLALLTIIILYAMIIIKLKRKWSSDGAGAHMWTVRKARDVQERKILQVAVAITIVFFACFIPQVILVIAAPLWALPLCSIEVLRFVVKITEQSYAAFNPIICLLFSQNYRDGFKSALTVCCRGGDRFTRDEATKHEAAKQASDYGEMAMTPLALRASIRRCSPSMLSSPAIMRAEGVVMNK